MMWTLHCKICGAVFDGHRSRNYCSDLCQFGTTESGPAVYCFTCPDGRKYVGSRVNIRNRKQLGVHRPHANPRVLKALKRYPPETWIFEILERMPRGILLEDLLRAEQRHIERLRSWNPLFGFNIFPAIWENDTPGVRAGREYLRAAWRSRQNKRRGFARDTNPPLVKIAKFQPPRPSGQPGSSARE
jgi:hypothetical protein